VRNYGESAWVSTQGVLKLILELKRETRRPQLVIFYDGVNDPYAAYQSGRFDVHENFDQIRDQFAAEGSVRRGSFRYLLNSNTLELLRRVSTRLGMVEPRRADLADLDPLVEANVSSYLQNVDIVEALAERYGFRYAFFWQPIIFTDKELTPEEQEIERQETRPYPRFEELYEKTYARIRDQRRSHLYYIADAFAAIETSVYLDLAHVTPEGNEAVAERMFSVLLAEGLLELGADALRP
jgi:hypothetical protein